MADNIKQTHAASPNKAVGISILMSLCAYNTWPEYKVMIVAKMPRTINITHSFIFSQIHFIRNYCLKYAHNLIVCFLLIAV